jgi:hypothetical protein
MARSYAIAALDDLATFTVGVTPATALEDAANAVGAAN